MNARQEYTIKLMKRYRMSYVMMLPYLLLFLLFVVVPVFVAIFFGFTDFDMINTPSFIGFSNYKKMILQDNLMSTE